MSEPGTSPQPPRSDAALRGEIFHYLHHPHLEGRKDWKRKAPAPEARNALTRFNAYLAVKITDGVGTMWCAYLFAIIAFISLPDAWRGGRSALIAWVAQTFLQLVLLSIIIVGQKTEGQETENRASYSYREVSAILHEVAELQRHLSAQDEQLKAIRKTLVDRQGADPATAPD